MTPPASLEQTSRDTIAASVVSVWEAASVSSSAIGVEPGSARLTRASNTTWM